MGATAAALFGVFLILVILKVPIAVSLGGASLVAIGAFTNIPIFTAMQRFFTSCDNFSMMAIPFFMIAGSLMARGGVSRRLVNFANSLVGALPGGLAIVAIVASLFFGALSGSSTATVAAIGAITVPYMIEAGYSERFSLATVGAAGFLGVIIPPSIPMINYATSMTGVSIGDMFMAGFLPGFILALGLSIVAIVYGKKNVPVTVKFSWRNVWTTFKDAFWALLMPVIILGGIYGGFFTATESGCIACFYGLFVGIFVYREIKPKDFYDIMVDSVTSTGMIMLIVAAAGAFGFVMTRELIPVKVAQLILSVSTNKYVFLILVNLLLLVVGTFMETNAAIVILAPMMANVLTELHINPIHFGIVMIVNLAIGMITPPLGVNLYVAAGLRKAKVDAVVNKHLLQYLGVCLAILLLLTFVEPITMLVPDLIASLRG